MLKQDSDGHGGDTLHDVRSSHWPHVPMSPSDPSGSD
jgi:hypothetical protein